MASIFVSYAREDRTFTERLAQVLEEAGHSVWWDRRIDGGSEFAGEIEAALDTSDVVIVLWSKSSVKSRWVRDEAAAGGDAGRLVPVSIDGSIPPIGFRQFHTLELKGWKAAKGDVRTSDFLRAVERQTTGNEAAKPARTGLAGSAWAPRRRMLIAASALLFAAAAAWLLLLSDRQSSPPPRPTIALAAFTTASQDANERNLAARTRDSLSHSLSRSGLPVRLVSAIPTGSGTAGDFIVSGEVSSKGNNLVATVRMDDTAFDVTVFSLRFEERPGEREDLPERIAAQIAGTIAWAAPLIALEKRHPTDAAVMADLLNQLSFTSSFGTLNAYQATVRAAASAPDSAFAQLSLAFNTAFSLEEIPREQRGEAVAAARRAAARALAVAPEFGDSYGVWCFLHSETYRAECEDRLRAGGRVDRDAPFLNTFLSHVFRATGRLDEAVEVTRLSLSRDPYVPTKISWMLRMLEYSGASEEARERYREGIRWWPEFQRSMISNRLMGAIDRGDFEGLRRIEREVGRDALPPGYQPSEPMLAALQSKSATAARQLCGEAEPLLLAARCMILLSWLGDQDSAFAIADRLYPRRVGSTPAETERIWLDDPAGYAPPEFIASPAAEPLRRDPRYLLLVQRLGLLDYWRTGRLPDFCRKDPEPICRSFSRRA